MCKYSEAYVFGEFYCLLGNGSEALFVNIGYWKASECKKCLVIKLISIVLKPTLSLKVGSIRF